MLQEEESSAMSCVSIGGEHYHKLEKSQRRTRGTTARRRRRRSGGRMLWTAMRRVVVRAVALWCVGLRRCSQSRRRIVWDVLLEKVRKATGTRNLTKKTGYDPTSYEQNFDDGRWREEEDYQRSGSFAYRFGRSGRFADFAVGE